MTLREAFAVIQHQLGYERCFRKDHGLGKEFTHQGKTAIAKYVVCPIISFYPKPTYLFHTKQEVIAFALALDPVWRDTSWRT